MGCACSTPTHIDLGYEWDQLGGSELEPPVRQGWIKLLDARWLVRLAASGGVLSRQQDLPPEAFVSLDALRAAGTGTDGRRSWLRLIVLSHPWLHPSHPDPHGENLTLIAKVLRVFLDNSRNSNRPYGVLIDYAAMPQAPWKEEEEDAFKCALSELNLFYSHPQTVVLKITTLPEGYPGRSAFSYDLPEGANTGFYVDRGWCYAESVMSGLVKGSGKVLDLGSIPSRVASLNELLSGCRAQREPPLHPEVFRAELDTKTFTSKTGDFDSVAKLYSDAFELRLGAARELNFSGLGWNAVAAKRLVKALSATTSLEDLHLSANELGDEGAILLGEVLSDNDLIKRLILDENQVSDGGARGLGHGLSTNSTLLFLSLSGNRVGDEGACHLGEALSSNCALLKLNLHGNLVGNEGAQGLGQALVTNEHLMELNLDSNLVGDVGTCGLGTALSSNVALTELSLDGNQVGDEGVVSLSDALATNTRLMVLGLSYNTIGAEGARSLGEALVANPSLLELCLDGNEVGDEGAIGLGQGLTKNHSLRTLWLQNNQVGDEGAAVLGQELMANSTLESLYIRANNVGRNGRRALEEAAGARMRHGFKRLSLRF